MITKSLFVFLFVLFWRHVITDICLCQEDFQTFCLLFYYHITICFVSVKHSVSFASGILSVPTRNPEIDEPESCRYNSVNLKCLIAYPASFTDSMKGRDFPCSANENTNT